MIFRMAFGGCVIWRDCRQLLSFGLRLRNLFIRVVRDDFSQHFYFFIRLDSVRYVQLDPRSLRSFPFPSPDGSGIKYQSPEVRIRPHPYLQTPKTSYYSHESTEAQY